ncbi:MAG: polymerase subunit alpha, partial [Thermoanaerobacter sp.]|nr:polymerase subunit alpha [Thermoanaerobacter sp.]
VLPPDINESDSYFTVVEDKIRFGLSAVKNVGLNMTMEIVSERERNGKFKSVVDFFERMQDSQLNKKAVESLIKAGAFSSFGVRRSQLLSAYDKLMENIKKNRNNNLNGQISLFGEVEQTHGVGFEFPDLEEFPKSRLLSMEKETLGLYISGHPLEEYMEDIPKITNATTLDFKVSEEEMFQPKLQDNQEVVIAGVIATKKIKFTKNNNMMAFVTIEDLYGTVEVIVFPTVYEKYSSIIKEDNPVVVRGKVSLKEEEEPKILCDEIKPLSQAIVKKLYLNLQDSTKIEIVKQILRKNPGNMPVVLKLNSKKLLAANRDLWVNGSKELIKELHAVLGEENVKVV